MNQEALNALYFFVFLGGLMIGSFLNVVIYRVPREESIVTPRSQCPSCKTPIPWYRNFPLVSFAIQWGRCHACRTKISFRYPIVELLTAVLIFVAAKREPNFVLWPFDFFFVCALVASTFIDLDHWIIPDKITLPGIVLGFLSAFFRPENFWLQSLAGILFGGGILMLVGWAYYLIAKKDGIGGGDVKFLAFVGAFLGFQGALVTLIMSSVLGSILGIFLIAFRGKKGGTAIPFGPFLSLGALSAFLYGPAIWQWYFNF